MDRYRRKPEIQTVSLSFFRFSPGVDRLWAFAMMGLARPAMRRTGATFWKLFGSGTGEGFTPVPNFSVYAILAVWPDGDMARVQTGTADIFRRYQAHAQECWTVFLTPGSARGTWSGRRPFDARAMPADGPVAVLTRASIRPLKALRFWRHEPGITRAIGADPNVIFKIGIGEVPWLYQVTFSIWPDTAAMARFARRDGPHARAIRSVREGKFFREELYARFQVTGACGTWQSHRPLDHLGLAA